MNKKQTQSISINALMDSSGVRFGTSGIRGLVASMTEEVCHAYVTAFLQEVVIRPQANQRDAVIGMVLLGHDLRPSSPHIARVCASAIENAGGVVVYAGALPTPALAYYAQLENIPAVVVTGSHIPFDRNGIKFYSAQGEISKSQESEIQHAYVSAPNHSFNVALPEINKSAEARYIERYVDFFANAGLSGLRVAIYEHSSVARDLLRTILEALGVEVIGLGRTDEFVPIDTEAVRPEDVVRATSWADHYTFDAIFSTDGDADRPLIADEHGQWLRGDLVGMLCAKYLKAGIVVTPVSSSSLAEKSDWFALVMRTKIGSPYVLAAMHKASVGSSQLVVGFEANGGVLLGGNVVCDGKVLTLLATRDAVLPILTILAMKQQLGCQISEIMSGLPGRYTHSDRLQNFSGQKSSALLKMLEHNTQQIQAILAPGAGEVINVDITDGLRVCFSHGEILHLRPSGNAPELRCYAEAETSELAKYLCDQCLMRIAGLLI